MTRAEFIERVAAIEHEQWMKWAQALVAELQPLVEQHNTAVARAGGRAVGLDIDLGHRMQQRLDRWKGLMVPYGDLSEESKASDREWAERVWAIVAGK